MKKVILSLILAIMCVSFAGAVYAQPFTSDLASDSYDSSADAVPTPNDKNDAIPDIFNAINQLLGTGYTDNEQVDFLQHTSGDNLWNDLGGTYVAIGLTADNANTLSVYAASDSSTLYPVLGPHSGFGFLGDGSFADPYPAGVSPIPYGTAFGFHLASVNPDPNFSNAWYSDPTLNSDGYDHMITYHLSGLAGQTVYIKIGNNVVPYKFNDPYLIGWEDLKKGAFNQYPNALGDGDYDDIIYLVDRVYPIPEPMTMALFGSGLVGLLGVSRRKK